MRQEKLYEVNEWSVTKVKGSKLIWVAAGWGQAFNEPSGGKVPTVCHNATGEAAAIIVVIT